MDSGSSGTSPATGEDGFSPGNSEEDSLETQEGVSEKRCVVFIFTTCFVLMTFDVCPFETTGQGGEILSLEGCIGGGQVEEAQVEDIMTVGGFNSEEAVLDTGMCLIALVVPFIRLIFTFPIDGFLTSRCFRKGVETIQPEDLIPI